MQCNLELGDDPKVAAATTNGPIEVRVLVRAGAHQASICQDQFCGKDVVAAKTVLAHERTDAPSEKKPSNAHGRTLPKHRSDSRLCGLNLNCATQHSAAQTGMTFVGSNGHTAEAGHVEHKASIAGGVSGIAVASAAYGERQMVGACEAQGGLDVLRVGGMHYERGMRGKLGRIAFAKLLVLWVAGAEDCFPSVLAQRLRGRYRSASRPTAPRPAEKSWALLKMEAKNKRPARGKNADS